MANGVTRYRAAVFDMDGTVVDNMSFHWRAWTETLRALGVSVDGRDFQRRLAGKTNAESFSEMLNRPLSASELERYSGDKEQRYREIYAPHLAPVRGLDDLLGRIAHRGLKLAIATAAPRENRDFVLSGLGLHGAFAAVVGPEHAPRGKPYPDLYLAAARALGLSPATCLVFEDAPNGVVAARAAGMDVVGVTTSTCREELLAAGAIWVCADFDSLPSALEQALDLT